MPDPSALKVLNKVLDSKEVLDELIDVNKPIKETMRQKSAGELTPDLLSITRSKLARLGSAYARNFVEKLHCIDLKD